VIKQRILTALIVLPLLLFVTLVLDSQWVFCVTAGVLLLALQEAMALFDGLFSRGARGLTLGAGLGLFTVAVWWPAQLLLALVLALLLCACYLLSRYQCFERVLPLLGAVSFCWLYLPLLLSPLVLLHAAPDGRLWVLLVLLTTMLSDSAAYFVGSAWGRRRLAARISPKKSIEGAFGGLAGALLGAAIFGVVVPQISCLAAVGAGFLAGIFGPLGDLFESLLKRAAGIKDSGHLFPGHGGMLDRLDSLLFSFPVVYLYVLWLTGAS
jgi:phosphatidate cytidylyltransferase